jgi:sterol desaturase/sphingolipid hydroxylase (fatty acid hydroxylase superfamily)/CDGSH-type Zn-finger protein
MDKAIFGIEHFDVYMVLGVLIVFGLLEAISGQLALSQRTKGDWIQEVGSFFVLSVLIKPLIVFTAYSMGTIWAESYQFILKDWSLLILLPAFLLIDDLLQYWYHRSAHEYPFLWKLHRPHHQAEEMGFFVSYRNAALYYLLMPNIWWIAIVTFLGGAKAVAIGLILKQFVIIGSHSTLKWDKPFYHSKVLRPLISLLERIIVTPAFHHAHHGKSKLDGVSDPNGNFGNMFSIWDQLFGSALYTRNYPVEYGLQNNPKEHWSAAYLYPVLKSQNPKSEISSGFTKQHTATNQPIFVELEKGNRYLWCQCGKSKDQPFCDGSHHGTKFKPLLFEVKRTGKTKLCNCKKTGVGPFCDDSHLKFQ